MNFLLNVCSDANIIFRLEGKVKLYDLDNPAETRFTVPTESVEGDRAADPNTTSNKVFQDDLSRTTKLNDIREPLPKETKSGDIHITVWRDPQEKDPKKERKWIVGVTGVDVKIVPMMNEFFSRTVTGSSWIKFHKFGEYAPSFLYGRTCFTADIIGAIKYIL